MSKFDELLAQYRVFLDAAVSQRAKETEKFLIEEQRKATQPESVVGEALFKQGFRVKSRVSDVIEAIYNQRHSMEEAQAVLSPLQDEWTDYQRTLYYHPDVFDRFFVSHTGSATSLDNDLYAIKCFEKNVTLVNLCDNELWALATRRRHGLAVVAPLNEGNIGRRPFILSRIRSAIMACERDQQKVAEAAAIESRKRGRSTLAAANAHQRELQVGETHRKHDSQMRQECIAALKTTQAFVIDQLSKSYADWTSRELLFYTDTLSTIETAGKKVVSMASQVADRFQEARNSCMKFEKSPHGTDDPVRTQRDFYLQLCNDSFNAYVKGFHTAISNAPQTGILVVLTELHKVFDADMTAHRELLNKHVDTESVRFGKEQEALLRTSYLQSCRTTVTKALRDSHSDFDETLSALNVLFTAHPITDPDHPNTRLVNAVDHITKTLAAQRTATKQDAKTVEDFSVTLINKILHPLGLQCIDSVDAGTGARSLEIPSIKGRSYKSYFERIRLCVHADVSLMRSTLYSRVARSQTDPALTPVMRKAQALQAIHHFVDGHMPHGLFTSSNFLVQCLKGVQFLQDEEAVIAQLDLGRTVILSDGGPSSFTSATLLHSYWEYATGQYEKRVQELKGKKVTLPVPAFEEPTPAQIKTTYVEWFVHRESWAPFFAFCSQRVTELDTDLSHLIPAVNPWIANAKQAMQHSSVSMQPLFRQVADIVRNIAKAEMMHELAVCANLL